MLKTDSKLHPRAAPNPPLPWTSALIAIGQSRSQFRIVCVMVGGGAFRIHALTLPISNGGPPPQNHPILFSDFVVVTYSQGCPLYFISLVSKAACSCFFSRANNMGKDRFVPERHEKLCLYICLNGLLNLDCCRCICCTCFAAIEKTSLSDSGTLCYAFDKSRLCLQRAARSKWYNRMLLHTLQKDPQRTS